MRAFLRLWMTAAALAVLVLGPSAPALRAQGPKPQPATPAGAAVMLDGEEVFRIQSPVGSFSPQARAEAVSKRLADLAKNPFAASPAFQVVDDGTNANAMVGDGVIFSVTPEDARLAGVERLALAQDRVNRVGAILASHSLFNRAKSLGIGLLLTLLITLGAWFVYRGLRWGFVRLEEKALTFASHHVDQTLSKRFEWLPLDHVGPAVSFAIKVLRFVTYAVAAYIYLSAIFSLFPWTRGLAERLLAFALGPLSTLWNDTLGYLPKLFFLVLIILATRYLLKAISLTFGAVRDGKLRLSGFHSEWAEPTYRLVRILVLAFALVVAFPYLPGSQSEAFKGVSLFVGVLFSLGSSGAVGNMVAGVLITYMRPFKPGDRIQVGDTVGDVIERTALVTRVRTIKNVDVTIPNATILSSQVQNFSANAKDLGLILHTTVTIGYDVPWATVHDLLIKAALSTDGILPEPRPFVFQTSLDDFYVSYQINAYTDQPNRMAAIYSTLHSLIQDRFNEGGVEILSPHFRQLRDGNATTIPAGYLPESYVAPSFRLQRTPDDPRT